MKFTTETTSMGTYYKHNGLVFCRIALDITNDFAWIDFIYTPRNQIHRILRAHTDYFLHKKSDANKAVNLIFSMVLL